MADFIGVDPEYLVGDTADVPGLVDTQLELLTITPFEAPQLVAYLLADSR